MVLNTSKEAVERRHCWRSICGVCVKVCVSGSPVFLRYSDDGCLHLVAADVSAELVPGFCFDGLVEAKAVPLEL